MDYGNYRSAFPFLANERREESRLPYRSGRWSHRDPAAVRRPAPGPEQVHPATRVRAGSSFRADLPRSYDSQGRALSPIRTAPLISSFFHDFRAADFTLHGTQLFLELLACLIAFLLALRVIAFVSGFRDRLFFHFTGGLCQPLI